MENRSAVRHLNRDAEFRLLRFEDLRAFPMSTYRQLRLIRTYPRWVSREKEFLSHVRIGKGVEEPHRILRQVSDLRSRLEGGPRQARIGEANVERLEAGVAEAKESVKKLACPPTKRSYSCET